MGIETQIHQTAIREAVRANDWKTALAATCALSQVIANTYAAEIHAGRDRSVDPNDLISQAEVAQRDISNALRSGDLATAASRGLDLQFIFARLLWKSNK